MISRYTPPETYQQWLDCFAHLREHPLDGAMLDALAQGKYTGTPAETFLVRLSDAVGLAMTGYCKRFLRQLDQALEDGEPDLAVLLARRLQKHLRKCFFYRSLPFLPASYVQTLDGGFRVQLDTFWMNFLTQLGKSARESMDPGMEDLLLEMKRIRLTDKEAG